jgi:DNA-directed RNA polymerase subunit RPC12/RpoP
LAKQHEPTDSIRCSRCGKIASTPVPAETIVRAYIECPECVAGSTEPSNDEFLKSLGFAEDKMGALTLGALHIKYGEKPYACVRTLPIPVPTNQSDVSELIRLLGLEKKR